MVDIVLFGPTPPQSHMHPIGIQTIRCRGKHSLVLNRVCPRLSAERQGQRPNNAVRVSVEVAPGVGDLLPDRGLFDAVRGAKREGHKRVPGGLQSARESVQLPAAVEEQDPGDGRAGEIFRVGELPEEGGINDSGWEDVVSNLEMGSKEMIQRQQDGGGNSTKAGDLQNESRYQRYCVFVCDSSVWKDA